MDQRTFHVCICDFFCADSDHNDNVISTLEMFFLKPITFSYQSCKMVSHNTVSYFFTYGNTKSVLPKSILFFIHDKRSVGGNFRFDIQSENLYSSLKIRKISSKASCLFYIRVEEKATYMRPKLITVFFLLLFWQLILFFRLLCSFLL